MIALLADLKMGEGVRGEVFQRAAFKVWLLERPGSRNLKYICYKIFVLGKGRRQKSSGRTAHLRVSCVNITHGKVK